jgi:hypothetical protein
MKMSAISECHLILPITEAPKLTHFFTIFPKASRERRRIAIIHTY